MTEQETKQFEGGNVYLGSQFQGQFGPSQWRRQGGRGTWRHLWQQEWTQKALHTDWVRKQRKWAGTRDHLRTALRVSLTGSATTSGEPSI